jgi:hypothetical protein
MGTEQDLIQKLMISKKIMEKHNEMGRGQVNEGVSQINVENFEPVNATYNLPQEFMTEQPKPKMESYQTPTRDRIINSKLPDEIKQLMIEHPIEKPNMGVGSNPTLSDDLIERASRLMGTTKPNQDNYQEKRTPITEQKVSSLTEDSIITIQSIVRETIEEVLRENGLIVESETKSNEVFKFRVGKHIFEGKLTKIKKITE